MPAAVTASLNPLRLLHRQAQWLLAQDLLARLGRRDDRFGMKVMRKADVHGIDVGRREQVSIVEVDAGAACARGEAFGMLAIDVGDRGDGRRLRVP